MTMLDRETYLALLRQDANAWSQTQGYTVPRILKYCHALIVTERRR